MSELCRTWNGYFCTVHVCVDVHVSHSFLELMDMFLPSLICSCRLSGVSWGQKQLPQLLHLLPADQWRLRLLPLPRGTQLLHREKGLHCFKDSIKPTVNNRVKISQLWMSLLKYFSTYYLSNSAHLPGYWVWILQRYNASCSSPVDRLKGILVHRQQLHKALVFESSPTVQVSVYDGAGVTELNTTSYRTIHLMNVEHLRLVFITVFCY